MLKSRKQGIPQKVNLNSDKHKRDQIKTENLISRCLSKLTKSIGKLLNIDLNKITLSNDNST